SRRTTCLAVQHDTGHSNTPSVRVICGRRFFFSREGKAPLNNFKVLKDVNDIRVVKVIREPTPPSKTRLGTTIRAGAAEEPHASPYNTKPDIPTRQPSA
ncbi:MAG: hypothetical protein J6J75_02135, partial [Alistipes sp.]|nr:hypothetical protein [Alistipes sp.]